MLYLRQLLLLYPQVSVPYSTFLTSETFSYRISTTSQSILTVGTDLLPKIALINQSNSTLLPPTGALLSSLPAKC